MATDKEDQRWMGRLEQAVKALEGIAGKLDEGFDDHEKRITALENKNGNGKSIIQIALDKGSWAAIGAALVAALSGKGAH